MFAHLKMASGVRKLPVRTGKRLRLPFAVLDKLRSMKTGQNVSLHCDNAADADNTFEATITPDSLEIEISKVERGKGQRSTSSAADSGDVRRSSRRKNSKSALELLGITRRKTQPESPGRSSKKSDKGSDVEPSDDKNSSEKKTDKTIEESKDEILQKDDSRGAQTKDTVVEQQAVVTDELQVDESGKVKSTIPLRQTSGHAADPCAATVNVKETEPTTSGDVPPEATYQKGFVEFLNTSSELSSSQSLVNARATEGTGIEGSPRNEVEEKEASLNPASETRARRLTGDLNDNAQSPRPSTRAHSAAQKQMVTRSSPRQTQTVTLDTLQFAKKRRPSTSAQDPVPKRPRNEAKETNTDSNKEPEKIQEKELSVKQLKEYPGRNEDLTGPSAAPLENQDQEISCTVENVPPAQTELNKAEDPIKGEGENMGTDVQKGGVQKPEDEVLVAGDLATANEVESTPSSSCMVDPRKPTGYAKEALPVVHKVDHREDSNKPFQGEEVGKQQTPSKMKQRTRVTKKIVKAVVITPWGETKEVTVGEEVSTVKALEQIIAGSTGCRAEDISQLAHEVNRELEKTMTQTSQNLPSGTTRVNKGKGKMLERPQNTKRVKHLVLSTQGEGAQFSDLDIGEAATVETQTRQSSTTTMVEAVSKMALEALNQAPSDEQVTIEVSGGDSVDMDWLKHFTEQVIAGVQVIVLNDPNTAPNTTPGAHFDNQNKSRAKGPGRNIGRRLVEGVDDEGLVAHMRAEEKVRAKPTKHIISSDELAEMIDNLKPDDQMSNHVKINEANSDTVRHMVCKYCSVCIRDKHDFRRHMARHKNVEYKPWKCPICDYRAAVRAQIARHVNIHGEMKPFVCKECGKGFNFKQKLQLHLKYHLDIRDKDCPLCELAFHEYKTLKNHLLKIHKVTKVPKWNKRLNKPLRDLSDGWESEGEIEDPKKVKPVKEEEDDTQEGKQEDDVDDEAAKKAQPSREALGAGDHSQTDGDAAVVEAAEAVPTETGDNQLGTTQKPSTKQYKKHRSSLLYGTRKTFLYTQQYKMGLLPTADRNNVQVKLKTDVVMPMVPSDVSKKDKQRQRPRSSRVTSMDQLEPEMKQYCKVERSEDGNRVTFQCQVCDVNPFPSKTQFVHHLEQSHATIRAWKCHSCDYTCRMRSSLIVHMKLHTGIKDFCCTTCGKQFMYKQKLKNHMKHHLNLREFECGLCNKAFNEKNDLTKHISRVHVGERPWACELCSKAYKDQVQLRRHMEAHNETKTHLCEVCNKYYRSKMSLAQHMKSHTCMFHCEICDKNFGSYSGFMAHKVMHDESYEGYECDICSKILHTKGSLTRHRTVAHSNLRPFVCDDCGKQFKTKKDLKNHMVVHSTDRNFVCEICQFSCKRMESLRVHMRRHAEVKPFQCGACGKEYTQKHSLEIHLRHHTGSVEARCGICGREFFTKYQLEMHIKRKHQLVASETSTVVECGNNSLDGTTVNMDSGTLAIDSDKPVTVFMCEECNSVFLTQDSLAVHILAEHMKQGWTSATSTVDTTTTSVTTQPGQSLLQAPLGGELTMEQVEAGFVENTVEVTTEGEPGIGPDEAFQGEQTMETLVSISDPSSAKQKIVSLIHPVNSQEEESQQVAAESDESTTKAELSERFSLLESSSSQETLVAIADPSSNQEMLVPLPHSNFESLLAATEAEVQADGSYIDAAGDTYITVSTDDPTHPGDSNVQYVTISDSNTLVAMATEGDMPFKTEQCVAVAETIEIPIETEEMTG